MSVVAKICLIGFGEVGQTLADDLIASTASELVAWDVLFSDEKSNPSQALSSRKVMAAKNAAEVSHGADLVISAVTAAETLAAANAAAPGLKPGTWFVDMNSASPGIKRKAAHIIENNGGRYVEAAVMSPIGSKRIATSILLGGPHNVEFLPLALKLGFSGMCDFSPVLGKASAAKMCRSVMVKGIESLLTESLLTARQHDVEETVISSLSDLFPGPDWRKLSPYMISRSLQHGKRRAEEMREVARTVAEVGIEPLMSQACAERQEWSASHKSTMNETELEPMLDALIQKIKCNEGPNHDDH